MEDITSLKDLFHHQLKDIYNAEQQLIKALPTMAEYSFNKELKKTFNHHFEETVAQKQRLDEIGESLGFELTGKTCNAMQGLIEEAEAFISKKPAPDILDAGIIAFAQRIEHFEIAAYETAVRYAESLGYNEAAKNLQLTVAFWQQILR